MRKALIHFLWTLLIGGGGMQRPRLHRHLERMDWFMPPVEDLQNHQRVCHADMSTPTAKCGEPGTSTARTGYASELQQSSPHLNTCLVGHRRTSVYYEHSGIDFWPWACHRQAWHPLTDQCGGGSTITQQLA